MELFDIGLIYQIACAWLGLFKDAGWFLISFRYKGWHVKAQEEQEREKC